MSNETVVIQQSNLFLNVSGRRITALPDTGTIAIMEKMAAESALFGGLHNTAAHVISGSNAYRFTINVMPMSEDDAFIFAAVKAIRSLGKILGVKLTYETTQFVSGSVSIEAAAESYGVVIVSNQGDLEVDEPATAARRARLSAARPSERPFFDRGPGYARLSGGATSSELDWL